MVTNKASGMVVVFFGLTASGKSYLAEAWADLRGCTRFNTDVVRKSLAESHPHLQSDRGIDKGIYSPEFSRKTYERLLVLAEKALAGKSTVCVVLDGTYQRRRERQRVVERLAGYADVYFVCCRCCEAVTRARLGARRLDAKAVSDGTLDVYLSQREKFESPMEIPPDHLLELDTNASLEYLIVRLERFLGRSVPRRATGGKAGGDD